MENSRWGSQQELSSENAAAIKNSDDAGANKNSDDAGTNKNGVQRMQEPI